MSPLLTPDNASDGHIQLAQFTRPRPQAPGCPVLGAVGVAPHSQLHPTPDTWH